MRKKVMIVEDSRSVRGFVRGILERDGYEVWECTDGVEALATLRTVAPNLIITDVIMPEMDGLSLVKKIRELPEFRDTPILIHTTEFSEVAKQTGRVAGATGWIVKPANPDRLRQVVAQLLDERGRP